MQESVPEKKFYYCEDEEMMQRTRRKARTKRVKEDAIESMKNEWDDEKCKNQSKKKTLLM